MNSSKKRTNEFVFTTMRRVFVRFLEEIEDTKNTFRNYLTFNRFAEKENNYSNLKQQQIQKFCSCSFDKSSSKGQLISKCIFGVFNFFQKTNENKSTIMVFISNSFVPFGRIVGLKKSF